MFVNIEPEVIDAEWDSVSRASLYDLRDRLSIFFEVTERALTSRPAQLLETVEQMRAAGFGIALDDVGADQRSLALLRPDVVNQRPGTPTTQTQARGRLNTSIDP